MEGMSDEKLDQLLSEVIPQLAAEDAALEAELESAEPIPVPDHLRARVMGKAVQLSGIMAAAEARAQGVEINGWEPSPDGDREHYYMTRPELLEFLSLNK